MLCRVKGQSQFSPKTPHVVDLSCLRPKDPPCLIRIVEMRFICGWPRDSLTADYRDVLVALEPCVGLVHQAPIAARWISNVTALLKKIRKCDPEGVHTFYSSVYPPQVTCYTGTRCIEQQGFVASWGVVVVEFVGLLEVKQMSLTV